MLPLEGTLLEKLRKIEALHAGTKIDGEKEAARRAADRIRARLAELRAHAEHRDEELIYSLPDPWKRKLFVALCRRYGLHPFRDYRRRYSTVQVRAPKVFQERTLWPEFLALSEELDSHLEELTTRVIREAINDDVSEPTEQSPKALP
jgi:succinate dehydrogenase/fumarate reductase flavoprotein subunit